MIEKKKVYLSCLNLKWFTLFFSEGEKETKYYSTRYQLEELLDTLNPEYENDLISYLNEMKDDILKQMSYTEELTNASKGNKKTLLDIENGK